MGLRGVDFAFRPPQSEIDQFSKALLGAGYRFVVRYLSHDPGKNLTGYEVASYKAHGIGIVTVFEDNAEDGLGGGGLGVRNAKYAQGLLRGLHAPGGHGAAPVFAAFDFDMQPGSQESACILYAHGFAQVLGSASSGVYGGLRAVETVGPQCKYQWQTVAWSAGKWFSGDDMRQFAVTGTLLGVQYDLDEAMATDYGQWKWPTDPPPPLSPSRSFFFGQTTNRRQGMILQNGNGNETPVLVPANSVTGYLTTTGPALIEIQWGVPGDGVWESYQVDYNRNPNPFPVPAKAWLKETEAGGPVLGIGQAKRGDAGGAVVRLDFDAELPVTPQPAAKTVTAADAGTGKDEAGTDGS